MNKYELFLEHNAKFDRRLDELRKEQAGLEQELKQVERDLAEAILTEATGGGKADAKALRKRVKDIHERIQDLNDMIPLVEKARREALTKLSSEVEAYHKEAQAELVKAAEKQIEQIKKAKANYLLEVSKLKAINDQSRENADYYNQFRRLLGDDKFYSARSFSLDFRGSWITGWTPGCTAEEVKEALRGILPKEVMELAQ